MEGQKNQKNLLFARPEGQRNDCYYVARACSSLATADKILLHRIFTRAVRNLAEVRSRRMVLENLLDNLVGYGCPDVLTVQAVTREVTRATTTTADDG